LTLYGNEDKHYSYDEASVDGMLFNLEWRFKCIKQFGYCNRWRNVIERWRTSCYLSHDTI